MAGSKQSKGGGGEPQLHCYSSSQAAVNAKEFPLVQKGFETYTHIQNQPKNYIVLKIPSAQQVSEDRFWALITHCVKDNYDSLLLYSSYAEALSEASTPHYSDQKSGCSSMAFSSFPHV